MTTNRWEYERLPDVELEPELDAKVRDMIADADRERVESGRPLPIAVVETPSSPGYGAFQRLVKNTGTWDITSVARIPDELNRYQVLVLNSVTEPSIDQESVGRLANYVRNGGGCLSIHDSNSPISVPPELLDLLGLQLAAGGFQLGENNEILLLLVVGNPTDPRLRFPVAPSKSEQRHPILAGIRPFDIGDEYWAMNTLSDVTPLLIAECGDRIPVRSARLQQPLTVAGCRSVERGRSAFLLLGHYPATYSNPLIQAFLENSLDWCAKRPEDSSFKYDIFISFSSRRSDYARQIATLANSVGLKTFLSARDLNSGDVWDEKIREGLVSSREVCVLMSPEALNSEWVTTEWGAAWVLQRRITPILLEVEVKDLPDRLKRLQAKPYSQLTQYLKEVRRRARIDPQQSQAS